MIVDSRYRGIRIDKYIALNTDMSRSKIQKLISAGDVLINGKEISNNYKVKENDEIVIKEVKQVPLSVEAEDIKLDIVYEDDYLMIINKKSGMVVHPSVGHYNGTLVNGLLYHFNKSSSSDIRPGIVHRLDKDTSGLMVVAKDEKTHEALARMIKNKEIKRHYLALVSGVIMHSTGRIEAPVGRDPLNRQRQAVVENGKASITNFKVLKRFKDSTLVECELETGRTHQIRVHMKYIGHPVLNDPVYSKKSVGDFGQMLHSKSIEFTHPVTGEHLYFEVEVPQEFLERIKMEKENE